MLGGLCSCCALRMLYGVFGRMSSLLEIICQGRSVCGIMLLSCQNIPISPEFPQLAPGEKNQFCGFFVSGNKKSFTEDDLKREASSEA